VSPVSPGGADLAALNPVRRRCVRAEPGLCADVEGRAHSSCRGSVSRSAQSLPTPSRGASFPVGACGCACACARPRKLQHGWTLVHAGNAVRWTATDSRANVTLRHLLSFTAGITAYPCSAADTCARRAWCQRTAPPSAMSFAQPSASTDTCSTAHSHSLTDRQRRRNLPRWRLVASRHDGASALTLPRCRA
jgi:hypothetical protein